MNITNDKVTAYINGFYEPLNEELAALRAIGEEERVPIILKETERFLGSLLQIKKPRRILEIGTAIGYSAAFFAMVCNESRVITIERDQDKFETAVENMEKLGLSDRVHVLLGEGGARMERLQFQTLREGMAPFDFVFIDAAKSHYKEFWDAAYRVCAKGSVIVCDNVLLKGATASDEYDPEGRYKTNIRKMREFLEYVIEVPQADTSVLAVGDGLSVSVLI